MAEPTLATMARHSMDSPDWYTPEPFVEAARNVMGGIDVDPATDLEANKRIRAKTIYTAGRRDDGARYSVAEPEAAPLSEGRADEPRDVRTH